MAGTRRRRRATRVGLALAGALMALAAVVPSGSTGAPDCYTAQVRDYRALALGGDAAAQWGLADSYLHGIGLPRDTAAAAKWYRAAAEQGLAEPQRILGLMYAAGVGVAQDIAAARRWLRQAAVNGTEAADQALATLAQAGPAAIDFGAALNAQAKPRPRPQFTVCDLRGGGCGKTTRRSLIALERGRPEPGTPTARFIKMERCR